MRAFVIDGPMSGGVREVPEPEAAATEAVVEVDAVGLCGTDVELFMGTMPYIQQGLTLYPLRPGHEWAGTVRKVGAEVTSIKPGDRVTGDTFLGCGDCLRCHSGRHYLCEQRDEIGVRGGRAGALSERIAVPSKALHKIPQEVPATAGAFVEPGACALRAVRAAGVFPGAETVVWGTGTLGLLAAQFARALKGSVCVVGKVSGQLELATQLGFDDVTFPHHLQKRSFNCAIDATGSAGVPAEALSHVRPGGRLALLGVAPEASHVDTGHLVLNDITLVGVLGGSPLIDETIDFLARGLVQVQPLIAATVDLEDVAVVLSRGSRVEGSHAPKVQVKPALREKT